MLIYLQTRIQIASHINMGAGHSLTSGHSNPEQFALRHANADFELPGALNLVCLVHRHGYWEVSYVDENALFPA